MSAARGSARIAVASLAAAVLTLGACSSSSTGETSLPPADNSVPTDSPAHDLADGVTFAWVRGLTGDGFLIDPAEMLSGEEARLAAVEDGFIGEGEDLPNDFYIRDADDHTSVVAAAPDAEYALMLFDDGTPTETTVSYDEFVAALEGANPDVYGVVEGVIPAMVTIDGGTVTSIIQTYLP